MSFASDNVFGCYQQASPASCLMYMPACLRTRSKWYVYTRVIPAASRPPHPIPPSRVAGSQSRAAAAPEVWPPTSWTATPACRSACRSYIGAASLRAIPCRACLARDASFANAPATPAPVAPQGGICHGDRGPPMRARSRDPVPESCGCHRRTPTCDGRPPSGARLLRASSHGRFSLFVPLHTMPYPGLTAPSV